ncbi:hypothetical protein NE452_00670 [Paeniclostridium sordellii]|uniref:hypothetical protein n=1 Tax=Paraclostridium sordellii TaxID=1505 RepID=UPI0005DC6CB1|nr:hypothetical protein [Paeniclostridium sordellii]MCQ4696018.1 hypothetical protein [Paeniclostridium sordellii]CEN82364.1 Uncharacterised protein [[Clostridium] sordellii] [Paeniclostridium sordellii]CEO07886.1 Uncharacterised protein [[Clostridium] sordellii] [Paeniclostridium sordellii]
MTKKISQKYANLYLSFSIILSIIMIYFVFARGGIKAILDNGNWIITLGAVVANIANIYGGLSLKKKGIDVELNQSRVQGSIIILATICIVDLIPRIILKI